MKSEFDVIRRYIITTINFSCGKKDSHGLYSVNKSVTYNIRKEAFDSFYKNIHILSLWEKNFIETLVNIGTKHYQYVGFVAVDCTEKQAKIFLQIIEKLERLLVTYE